MNFHQFIVALPVVMGVVFSGAAETDYRPIELKFPIEAGSAIDFSRYLDAPAGKHGFAVNDDGVIRFGKGGPEFRAYGINLCFGANYPDKATAVKMADDIARIGYNTVRIHHFDNRLADRNSKDGTALDPVELDKLDYLIARLKERGIYIIIDLTVSRNLKKGVIPEFKIGGRDKAIFVLSDTAFKNYTSFAANWLNHVNPYTKLALKDDPALLSIGQVNEMFLNNPNRFRKKPIKKLFDAKFAKYCKANNITVTPENKRRHEIKYLNDLTADFYRKSYQFLKNLGVKSLIATESNDTTFARTLPENNYDMLDLHTYVGHPSFKGGWFKLPATYMNKSAIWYYGHNAAVRSLQRMKHVPLGVGEWDMVNPTPAACEGGFLIPAYAALQGWNSMTRFTYSHKLPVFENDTEGMKLFDMCHDPLRRLSERAGILFFVRGDIAESELELPLVIRKDFYNHPYTESKTDEFGRKELWSSPALMKRMGLIGRIYLVIADPGQPPKLDKNVPFLFTDTGMLAWKNYTVRPIINALGYDKELAQVANSGKLGKGSIDPKTGRFVSSTGELVFDRSKMEWSAVTPKSEAFLAEPGRTFAGNAVKFKVLDTRAALLAATLDGKKLSKSSHMLLLHLTSTRNTGMKFSGKDDEVIEEIGHAPVLMKHGRADFEFAGSAADFKLYALAFGGKRLGEVPLTVRGKGRFGFTADNFRGKDGVAAYELIRTAPAK